MVLFEEQKFLVLWGLSNLLIFYFIDHDFGTKRVPKKSNPVSRRFSPVFSRSFMLLGITLKSLVHFEFIFVNGMREIMR